MACKNYMTVFSTLLKTMDLAHKVNDKLEEIIVTSSLIKVCVRYCVFMSIYMIMIIDMDLILMTMMDDGDCLWI